MARKIARNGVPDTRGDEMLGRIDSRSRPWLLRKLPPGVEPAESRLNNQVDCRLQALSLGLVNHVAGFQSSDFELDLFLFKLAVMMKTLLVFVCALE